MDNTAIVRRTTSEKKWATGRKEWGVDYRPIMLGDSQVLRKEIDRLGKVSLENETYVRYIYQKGFT